MNWQAMFVVIAVICAIASISVGITCLVVWDNAPGDRPTFWLISLFLATLISAALAAGLSK